MNWQKTKRLDVVSLERARVQITNILQLVSSGPRSYNSDSDVPHHDWPLWDAPSSSFLSTPFGKDDGLQVAFDLEALVLSINGQNEQRQHLVLSGMSYPMAYGWMSIKLGSFGLDSAMFDDSADYRLESYLNPAAEISCEDQKVYDQLIILYKNADFMLHKLKKELDIKATVLIDPSNANIILITNLKSITKLGFSIGSRSFPEPYFFMEVSEEEEKMMKEKEDLEGMWNNARRQYILMSSDYLHQNPDQESKKVLDFFRINFKKITARRQ
jgi:hypothetical protein